MALYALGLTRQVVTGKIEQITLYDTDSGKVKDVSDTFAIVKLKRDKEYIANMYIGKDSKLHMKEVVCNRGYNKRLVKKLRIVEYYIVVLGYESGLINYIACGDNGETRHMISTVPEMLYELNTELNELVISNAEYEIDGSEFRLDVFDFESGMSTVIKYMDTTLLAADMRKKYSKYSDINLSVKDNKVRIDANYGCVGEVNIPDDVEEIGYVEGVNIIRAGRNSNRVCEYSMYDNGDITEFDGNNTVEEIGKCAFKNSTIKKLSGIESVMYIGDEAFSESMLSGRLNVNAEVIGKRAFYYTGLSRVNISKTKIINKEAFAYGYNLHELNLDEVEIIGERAFEGTDIRKVRIPSTCKVIQSKAFRGCSKLKEVYVHRDTKIEDGAFDKKCNILIYG